MSVENVSTANGLTRQVEQGSATATSSDTETVIATIDLRGFSIGTITAKNNGAHNVYLNVYFYNDPAYSDEGTAGGSTLNARQSDMATGTVYIAHLGTNNATTPGSMSFAYCRIKLVNKTTGAGHASSTSVFWCLKNT